MTKGVVYYTCLTHDPKIEEACRRQLRKAFAGQIVSVSLNEAVDFGENYVYTGKRCSESLFRQVALGLSKSTEDVVFLCESDVLYHPSHFDFNPPRRDMYYYNDNKWRVDHKTGHAVFYHYGPLSHLCCDRLFLIEHFKKRLARLEKDGRYDHRIGYEPGLNNEIDSVGREFWFSAVPNIDIRHENTITASRWRQDQFRDKSTCQGWKEADDIPGWGSCKKIMEKLWLSC
jgi:hypothetical protein